MTIVRKSLLLWSAPSLISLINFSKSGLLRAQSRAQRPWLSKVSRFAPRLTTSSTSLSSKNTDMTQFIRTVRPRSSTALTLKSGLSRKVGKSSRSAKTTIGVPIDFALTFAPFSIKNLAISDILVFRDSFC